MSKTQKAIHCDILLASLHFPDVIAMRANDFSELFLTEVKGVSPHTDYFAKTFSGGIFIRRLHA
ncbi:MAG: hypothetical protein PHP93_00040 [Kiritimatiellales bacterium]|nr:hypothetical protein [Kiritimatiellales bacterium]